MEEEVRAQDEPLFMPPSRSSVNDESTRLLSPLASTVVGESMVQTMDLTPRNVVGTSWFASVFIVINAALGAGFLAFPKAYDRTGGVAIALIMQSVMLVFAFIALILLAYCADLCNAATYQDVMQGMCGKWGRRLCALCITLYCFGTCITFLIIIGDQWDRFLYFASGDPYFCKKWYMNRKFLITITSIIFILPLCFPRRIDFLKHASALGVLGVAYVSIMVIVKYFVGNNHPGTIKTKPDHWTDVFVVVPTICFGYQCHVSVVPVYACLRERNLCNYTKTISLALAATILCYSTTAVFGYLTFGSNVNSDILVSYNTTGDVIAGIILLAIKVYTTYPILNFCGRSALDTFLLDVIPISPERIASDERMRRYVETLAWFGLTVLLSVTIPNISDVIALLGGFAVIFIFIFPGVCWIQICFRQQDEWSLWKYRFNLFSACFFIILGAFIFGLTTTQAITDDITGANDAHFNISGPCNA